MAENAILVEIVPEDPDRSIDEVLAQVKQLLPEGCEIKDTKVEPYVYGLKKIKVMILAPEREGLAYEIEEKLSTIEGAEAEVVSITRI